MTSYIYRFQDLPHILLKSVIKLCRLTRKPLMLSMVKWNSGGWRSMRATSGVQHFTNSSSEIVKKKTAGRMHGPGTAIRGTGSPGMNKDGVTEIGVDPHPRGILTHNATTGDSTMQSSVNDAQQQFGQKYRLADPNDKPNTVRA